MTKTMYRIRTPKFSSGALAHARIPINRFVEHNRALRITARSTVQPSCTLRLRWQLDPISGKPIAWWESGEEPGSLSFQLARLGQLFSFHYFLAGNACLPN